MVKRNKFINIPKKKEYTKVPMLTYFLFIKNTNIAKKILIALVIIPILILNVLLMPLNRVTIALVPNPTSMHIAELIPNNIILNKQIRILLKHIINYSKISDRNYLTLSCSVRPKNSVGGFSYKIFPSIHKNFITAAKDLLNQVAELLDKE